MMFNIVKKVFILTLQLENGNNVKFKDAKLVHLKIHVMIAELRYGTEKTNNVLMNAQKDFSLKTVNVINAHLIVIYVLITTNV